MLVTCLNFAPPAPVITGEGCGINGGPVCTSRPCCDRRPVDGDKNETPNKKKHTRKIIRQQSERGHQLLHVDVTRRKA